MLKTLCRAGMAAVLSCSLVMPAAVAAAAEPVDRKAVEQIIHDYLVNNPEVLLEAMKVLKERQQASADKETLAAIKQNRDQLFNDGVSFVAGNPNGKLTVVEFFDYRCGYCKQARPSVADALKRDGDVRLVLKEFPILGPDSVIASRAATAALIGQRDKYWAYHEALYDYKGRLSDDSVIEIAKSAGLDTAKLKQDMQSPKVEQILADNRKLAENLGISGTPAFIAGNQFLPGAVSADTLLAAIAEGRKTCNFC